MKAHLTRRMLPVLIVLTSMVALPWLRATAQPPSPEEKITLRFGHIQSPEHPHQKAALFFADRVKAMTNGRIVVQVFPAGQLGGELEMIESIQLGTLDLGLISTSAVSNLEPSIGLFDLPYLFTTRDQVMKAMDGAIGTELAKRLRAKGVRILGWGDLGFREISANKPINTPADLKGLKIRVPESRVMLATFRALGALPTPMAYPEVYTGLQQGAIDGEENPLAVIFAGKFYEVNKFISLTNHQYMPMLFVASNKVLSTLSQQDQTALLRAGQEAAQFHRKAIEEENARVRSVMERAGVKFTSPSDITPFVTATAKVYDENELRKLNVTDLVKQIRATK